MSKKKQPYYIPGGKGWAQRPMQVSQKQFDDNWDRIFGSKKRSKEVVRGRGN